MHPCLADILDRTAHADRIDLRGGAERSDSDWNIVAPPGSIDHVGEHEGAASVLAQSALELPAHQRMQLTVLVDRPVNAGH